MRIPQTSKQLEPWEARVKMIDRRTSKNKKCPECSEKIDRLYSDGENNVRILTFECKNCGDVTTKFYHHEVKRLWDVILNKNVPRHVFEYKYSAGVRRLKPICKRCYSIGGSHPLNYCLRCGGEMALFELNITTKEWIDKATNDKELENRLRLVYPDCLWRGSIYPNLRGDEIFQHTREILGV